MSIMPLIRMAGQLLLFVILNLLFVRLSWKPRKYSILSAALLFAIGLIIDLVAIFIGGIIVFVATGKEAETVGFAVFVRTFVFYLLFIFGPPISLFIMSVMRIIRKKEIASPYRMYRLITLVFAFICLIFAIAVKLPW
jgi:hypothetical protein